MLSGKALELIMDYYGNSTVMYLLSKPVFHKILTFKIDLHNSQKKMLLEKLNEYTKELKYLKSRDQFCLSKSLRNEFESDQ